MTYVLKGALNDWFHIIASDEGGGEGEEEDTTRYRGWHPNVSVGKNVFIISLMREESAKSTTEICSFGRHILIRLTRSRSLSIV